MFLTKTTPVPPDRAERRRRHAGAAAARCHDSGRDRAGADGRRAEAAHGILLHPARRDHGQHVARPRDGPVDAERLGRRLQAESDPEVARAAQALRHVVREPPEPGDGGRRAQPRAGHLAERHEARQRLAARACRRRSIRWWRSTSARTRRCRRSSWRRKPRSRRPPAAARRATTTPRSRSAIRIRRCPSSTTRARSSRSCSGKGTRRRSAPRSRTRRRACSTASPNARARLRRDLGAGDRVVLDNYLETVREIERRVQLASSRDLSAIEVPTAPIGELDAFGKQVDLMFDLIALAYRADLTRVASYIMVAEGTNRTYNHIGVSDSFHPVSHHANDLGRLEKLVKIQTWHMERFAAFVEQARRHSRRRRHAARPRDVPVRLEHVQQRPAQRPSAADDPRGRRQRHAHGAVSTSTCRSRRRSPTST